MSTATYAGVSVELNDEGFFLDPTKWTREIAVELAKADGIERRLPYNSDPIAREKINSGQMDYLDMHLSHLAPMVWQGVLGSLDTAVIEVSAIKCYSAIGEGITRLDDSARNSILAKALGLVD